MRHWIAENVLNLEGRYAWVLGVLFWAALFAFGALMQPTNPRPAGTAEQRAEWEADSGHHVQR